MEPIRNQEFNEFTDILMFANVQMPINDSITENLKGQARDNAIAKQRQKINSYKASLNFKFGEYLGKVEQYLPHLKDLDEEYRNKVADKLNELAMTRLDKEKEWGKIHRFFHKIGQFFRGHGFCTKGEFAIGFAARIKNIDKGPLGPRLETLIFDPTSGRKMELDDETKNEINTLSREEFNKLLDEVIFSKKTPDSIMKALNDSDKYVFFNNLSPEKKTAFYEQLFARKDWYEQATDIAIYSEAKTIKNFITDEMVQKFTPTKQQVEARYKNKMEFKRKFFDILLAKKIKSFIDQNDYSTLGIWMTDNTMALVLKKIVAKTELQVLSPDDIAALKASVEGFD